MYPMLNISHPRIPWASFWLDDIMIHEWQWSVTGPNMLGVIDIYATAPGSDEPFFFIDDVCFETSSVGIYPGITARTGINLFPNPVSEILNITSPDEISEVQIINTTGQPVCSARAIGNEIQVSTQDLGTGLYFVRLRTGNGYETGKFIKR